MLLALTLTRKFNGKAYFSPEIIMYVLSCSEGSETNNHISVEPAKPLAETPLYGIEETVEEVVQLLSQAGRPCIKLTDREPLEGVIEHYFLPIDNIKFILPVGFKKMEGCSVGLNQMVLSEEEDMEDVYKRVILNVKETPDEIVALIQQAQSDFQVIDIPKQANQVQIGMPK
jgi:hypothetical protein